MEFGRYNLGKFRKMGMLRNGVPSLKQLFAVWITALTIWPRQTGCDGL
ncbi:MAG: hypothetical protein L6U16_11590 [Porphyromonadaceae bacterium]|nr:MAG: hypothetical protein L6U16_11590 [Porphyromonadaceae bacterium]